MIPRGIYLAGPIENDDDPRNWREDLKERHPNVPFVDPMEWQSEWESDPRLVIERELAVVRNNPVLVANYGSDAPETTGTDHEIAVALENEQPVGIVPAGDLPEWTDHRPVQVFSSFDAAVKILAGKLAVM